LNYAHIADKMPVNCRYIADKLLAFVSTLMPAKTAPDNIRKIKAGFRMFVPNPDLLKASEKILCNFIEFQAGL
jgi:hypothetical protein